MDEERSRLLEDYGDIRTEMIKRLARLAVDDLAWQMDVRGCGFDAAYKEAMDNIDDLTEAVAEQVRARMQTDPAVQARVRQEMKAGRL